MLMPSRQHSHPNGDPAPGRRTSVPVVGLLAPLLVAGVIAIVVPSPTMIILALLAPIMSLATLADSAWQNRRRRRADDRAGALRDQRSDAERALEAEQQRGLLTELHPTAMRIVAGFADDRSARHGLGSFRLRLGESVDAAAGAPESWPVLHDGSISVGIVGPAPAVRAVARGYLIQLSHGIAASELSLSIDEPDLWPVTEAPGPAAGPTLRVVSSPGLAPAPVIALARSIPGLPSPLQCILELDDSGVAVLSRPDHPRTRVRLELVSRAAAQQWLARQAQADGEMIAPLPRELDRRSLEAMVPGPDSAALPVAVCIRDGRQAALELDLVSDGPHAVIAGTTGSGKTEFLLAWVAALVEHHRPEQLGILFIDFKGGTGFADFEHLPHCVGLITDLDVSAAARALDSLRAEIRRREGALRQAGVRDIAQCPGLARLVVIVDEYAAMVEAFPTLHALFTDLSARGRALGMHLIICTQRPSGVVRDSLLANCAIRISFRVTEAAESRALLGVSGAEALPSDAPGRMLVRVGSGTAILAHAARQLGPVRARAGQRPPVPWMPPLPPLVRLTDLERSGDGGLAIALADLTAQQRHGVFSHHSASGALVILGAAGSGRSGAMDAIAQLSGTAVIRDVEALWDAVMSDTGSLVIDDLDLLVQSTPMPWQQVLADTLAQRLRRSPAAGDLVALSAARLTGPLQALAALAGDTVQLRGLGDGTPSMIGGEALGPGAGWWRGVRVQLGKADARAPGRAARFAELALTPGLAVVTDDQDETALLLSRRGYHVAPPGVPTTEAMTARIADAATWLREWAALQQAVGHGSLLVVGGTPAELRALTGRSALPPVLDGSDRAWLLTGRRIDRVRLSD